MAGTNGNLQSMKTLKFPYTKFPFIVNSQSASFYLLFSHFSSDSVKKCCLLNLHILEGGRLMVLQFFFSLNLHGTAVPQKSGAGFLTFGLAME